MAVTIFYSWQSDRPNNVNRGFIEDALKKALKVLGRDDTIDPAIRDETITVDKDTQGLPGSPAIVDTILEKISNCAVFVPDLTFVGKSDDGRLLSNPNVLIEYGYALKALGNACILKIMNTHYGEVTADTLPFDMRHLRWPLTYNLSPEATPEQKAVVKAQLAIDLKFALAPMLSDKIREQAIPIEVYKPIQYTSDPSTFLEGVKIGKIDRYNSGDTEVFLLPGQHLFLRVIPKTQQPIRSPKELLDLMNRKLGPIGTNKPIGSSGRNRYGAFSWNGDWDTGETFAMTQLFKTGEIWGIDSRTIQESHLKDKVPHQPRHFPTTKVENIFHDSMAQYLDFSKNVLKLPLPLRYFAGASNVEGYQLTGRHEFLGHVVDYHINYQGGTIVSYEDPPAKILRPFLEFFWDECGVARPEVDLMP